MTQRPATLEQENELYKAERSPCAVIFINFQVHSLPLSLQIINLLSCTQEMWTERTASLFIDCAVVSNVCFLSLMNCYLCVHFCSPHMPASLPVICCCYSPPHRHHHPQRVLCYSLFCPHQLNHCCFKLSVYGGTKIIIIMVNIRIVTNYPTATFF